ncbi:protein kinase, putative [Leishmania tarentolae]|uniref:Protein kinase, putative n=1 Tax=Leishmania tarentolae TaxID=5689 RepID=A0A640KE34_LEITA|nr:protein kinase, putative [Leishmania tarentolae]
MLPSSAPPWGSGPPNLASYSTLATRDSTAKSAEDPTSAALHNLFTFSRRQSAECGTPSATPSSDEVAGRNIERCQCCTRLPLKGRMEEALLAPVLEKPRCTSTLVATQSTLETSHSGTDGGAVMSAHIRATSTELRTRMDDAPPMAVSAIFSCARPHLGMMAQVSSSIAISNQTSASAPPTPNNRRELSKMGRRPSSAPVFRLPSGTDLRALALVVFGVHHVKTNGWRDAPSPASLPVRQASSMVNSTDVTLVASDTHFDRSINERFNTVESDCTCAAAAPRTALGTCVAGVEAVPSFDSSNASANASARKDRHSSGTRACGVPSESVSLQPIGTSSFDSDGAAAEGCDSEVSVTAGTSETLGALHRGDDTPVTGGRCSRVRRRRSISTPVAGELGGFAPAASGASEAAAAASNPADHHLCVESCSNSGGGAGAEIEGVRCLFGRPMLSSLTSQRDGGGGGGAPAPPLGIFQSGLFLSMNEGDVPPASALEAPMTPQSFSMMLLARENGEGVLQHPVRAGSVSSAATTPTNGAGCSLPLPEGKNRMSRQSSHQVPPVVHGAETAGGGDGLRINRLEDWFVDGCSRDSHETRTTGMTLTSGVGPHSCMAAGSGSAACVLGGGYVSPLGSFQMLSGNRKQEIPISAVDADDIPSTPTDISALPHPPSPLSARRQRQRRACLHPDGDNAVRRNSRVDVETGVIETDTLVRARAVSKDGARTYEIVNEKYVMYDYELGKGSYSTVRLCYNLMNGYFYAVKVLDRVRLKHRQLGSEAGLCKIDQEIAMMKQVQHKNIIALHEVIRDPSMRYVYLVLELAESREVLSMRDNGDVLPRGGNGAATAYPEAATREIVKGLLQALMYAHYLGVAHRDIKPSNVLLKSDGTVKLCDFGVSVLVGDTPLQLNREGSVAFLAPELLLSSEVDVSRFVTPVDLSLGTTRNRGAAHMLTDDTLPSAARTTRTTVASSATATNETQLETTGWAMSSMEQGAKWTQDVMSASVGTVSEPGARASSRAPVRGFSSASGGSPSGIPTWPLSGSLPLRGDGGGAARRASFRPRSPLPFGAAGDACSARMVTASADPGIGGVTPETPPTAASSPATPAAQPLGCPSEAADQAPVDLFKADVFALGVTVYTILLGRLPWHASSAGSQRAAILAEPDPFLRLYKAAYGDAYIWPPQARDACWPPHGVLSSDSIPVSSQARRLASGNDARSANEGTENTEVRDRQQPISDEKDHGVAPAPATAFACKWRHYSSNTGTSSDDHSSEQDKCAPAAMKLADAPPSHCNAPTRSDGTSSPPVVKHSTTGRRLSDPVMQQLAMRATTSEGCPPSDRVEPQSKACGSRTAIDAPPPPTPVQQAQNLHLPQWKPFTDVILGTTSIKKATAADTAITQQPQMAVMYRRHGGGEHVDDDSRQMNARTACVRPRVSAIKTQVSRAATQPRLGLLVEVPRSGAICGDQRAALSGPVCAPPSRQSRPTTILNQLMPCRGAFDVDNDDGLASHPSEVVEGMNESTRDSRQCIQGSSSDLLQNDPSTVISTTHLYTGNVISSGITGRSTNSGEVDNASADDDDGSSSTAHGRSGISATSSLCSDDDEDSEACESIYERLFEMEQPCRAYTVAERMPLPPIPGVSQEISGEAVDFVRLCLCLDPAERRTVFELFRHPWIRGGERAPVVEANTSRESP